MKSLKKHRFLLFYIDARDVHDGSVAAAPAVAVAAVNFSLPSRQLPKKLFLKLVNLHKIFILKNATL
jgi:hypothetical protein